MFGRSDGFYRGRRNNEVIMIVFVHGQWLSFWIRSERRCA